MPPNLLIGPQTLWRLQYAPKSIDLVFLNEATTVIYRDALLALLAAEQAHADAVAAVAVAGDAVAEATHQLSIAADAAI